MTQYAATAVDDVDPDSILCLCWNARVIERSSRGSNSHLSNPLFCQKAKKKAHCFMTYRTVRIVAELRLRKSTACFARCSAVSTVVKTTPSCFNLGCRLFALRSQCDLGLITSKVIEHRAAPATQKERNPHRTLVRFGFLLVAEMGFEPQDLRVMSPTSCQTAPLRDIIWCRKPGSNRYEIKSHGILSPGRLPIPPFRHMRPCVPTLCLSIISLEI